MLNKHSGLIAISGFSSDMREILQAMNEGNANAQLAFDMFEYRLRKYIGSYIAAMNGLDVLVFTAGIGENVALLREKICNQLTFVGVKLDPILNDQPSNAERRISSTSSTIEVLVIPTNEELIIARDTYNLMKKQT
jgi:acetate kinase